jgi:predicted DsbA family dithiol-disulfide isomerase
MLDAQMDLHETRGLSLDRVRALAEEIGMDVSMLNNRLRSGLYRNVVLEQRNAAAETGLNSVPAVIINGKFAGSRSVECLGQFIEEAAG